MSDVNFGPPDERNLLDRLADVCEDVRLRERAWYTHRCPATGLPTSAEDAIYGRATPT